MKALVALSLAMITATPPLPWRLFRLSAATTEIEKGPPFLDPVASTSRRKNVLDPVISALRSQNVLDPGVSAFRRNIQLDVVLLIDVSHSVTHPGFFKTDKALVPDAAAGLAAGLEPTDHVRLGTFGTTIAIAPEILQGRAAIARAAAAIAEPVGGPSPVWDAIDAAATALDGALPPGSGPAPRPGSAQTQRRRAVIVVTDGRSAGNRIRFAELLSRLEGRQVAVCVVALDVKRPPLPDPAVRLRQLTSSAGGVYILVKRGGVDGAVSKAIEALRSRPD